jgi:hypothetical protein
MYGKKCQYAGLARWLRGCLAPLVVAGFLTAAVVVMASLIWAGYHPASRLSYLYARPLVKAALVFSESVLVAGGLLCAGWESDSRPRRYLPLSLIVGLGAGLVAAYFAWVGI